MKRYVFTLVLGTGLLFAANASAQEISAVEGAGYPIGEGTVVHPTLGGELGFTFGEPWEGFYAIGHLDGLEVHLKEAPKHRDDRQYRRDNEHLDAAAGVDGIEAFFNKCVANGVTILKPLAPTEWGTKDFYVEDPDGYIICFGGR